MASTKPKTDWANGELVTAAHLNAIGENLAALKNLPTAVARTSAEIIVAPDEFADVDSNILNLSINTVGGDLLVYFCGSLASHGTSGTITVVFDVSLDGNLQGGVNGIGECAANPVVHPVSIVHVVQKTVAGSHIAKLQWKRIGQGHQKIRLLPGARFWVREI